MSAETLRFHHGKHHKAYVDKTNALLADHDRPADTLVEVIRGARTQGNKSLFNNSAQLWNHSFFWQCLAPPSGQRPSGALARQIEHAFGSTTAMLEKLKEEAVSHFSNGWAWLVLEKGELRILSLHDADTPIVHDGLQPLLTLDVWEHAYYIDYRNARPDFVSAVLENLIDWDFVEANLDGRGAERADQELAAAPA
jgi:Fe-Mn family superoxide dismutase